MLSLASEQAWFDNAHRTNISLIDTIRTRWHKNAQRYLTAIRDNNYPLSIHGDRLLGSVLRQYRFVHPKIVDYLIQYQKKEHKLVYATVAIEQLNEHLSWADLGKKLASKGRQIAPPEYALGFGLQYRPIAYRLATSLLAGCCLGIDNNLWALSLSLRPKALEAWVTWFDDQVTHLFSRQSQAWCLTIPLS